METVQTVAGGTDRDAPMLPDRLAVVTVVCGRVLRSGRRGGEGAEVKRVYRVKPSVTKRNFVGDASRWHGSILPDWQLG